MLKTFMIWGRIVIAATIILFGAAQVNAAGIGQFQFVIGDVVVTDAGGKTRDAVKGADVNEGDTVGTAALASACTKQAVETAKIAFLTGVGWLAGIAGLERGQFYLGGFAL